MIARNMIETKAIAGVKLVAGETILLEDTTMTIISFNKEVIIITLKKLLSDSQINKLIKFSTELKIIKGRI